MSDTKLLESVISEMNKLVPKRFTLHLPPEEIAKLNDILSRPNLGQLIADTLDDTLRDQLEIAVAHLRMIHGLETINGSLARQITENAFTAMDACARGETYEIPLQE